MMTSPTDSPRAPAETPSDECPITFGQDNTKNFGTTREEYKLWVDYVFDLFHASLDLRLLRFGVAGFCAVIVWAVGLIGFALIGSADIYVRTPGVYFYLIGIAWCLNALRWLSQTYHIRTNTVRPCFPICDSDYKVIVSPYAKRATDNAYIFRQSALYAVLVWAVLLLVVLVTDPSLCDQLICTSSAQIGIFPGSLGLWLPLLHNHDVLTRIVSTVVLDLYVGIAITLVFTGAHLTRSTAPLYGRLASLAVIPFPKVIIELFQGVINLYSTGALMWTFGIVLAELLYEVQIEPLSITFIIMVSALSLFAFILPRRAVERISQKSLQEALNSVFAEYYAGPPKPKPASSADLARFNQDVSMLIESQDSAPRISQVLLAVASQVIPIAIVIFQSFPNLRDMIPMYLYSLPH
jgi:hypothetical protein